MFNMKGDNNPARRLEVREKIRLSKLGIKRPDLSNKYKREGNPNWKGDNVKYNGLHRWVENNKSKTKICQKCGVNLSFELSNISGRYKRDINDYEWLCRSCHSKQHRGKEWHDKMFELRIKKRGGKNI